MLQQSVIYILYLYIFIYIYFNVIFNLPFYIHVVYINLFLARGWQAIQSQWNVPLINSVAFDGTYLLFLLHFSFIFIDGYYIYLLLCN